eukprot:12886554-Prorocentrum_lima.AAC.1
MACSSALRRPVVRVVQWEMLGIKRFPYWLWFWSLWSFWSDWHVGLWNCSKMSTKVRPDPKLNYLSTVA